VSESNASETETNTWREEWRWGEREIERQRERDLGRAMHLIFQQDIKLN
jgi:hypothetical protein